MAFETIDMPGVIQRPTRECSGANNNRLFLIEAASGQQAWANGATASEPAGSDVCSSCRHRQCRICEEYSVAKEYSDYWICHCCGALTHRLPNWH